uniref:DNA polymerase III subunit delta n=1 Tax=Paulinella longichromatophora TaxID=1708747 RepID=A0A2H4ZP33_9EUKA|nr:DNA polymerase III subunit delta [Paulinella longichromatophora]
MISNLFFDLLGQFKAKELLLSSLSCRKIAPAYLFYGPKGVGRTIGVLRFLEGVLSGVDGNISLRRRLAEHSYPDMLWIEPTYQVQGQLVLASHLDVSNRVFPQIRISQVREALEFLAKQPIEGSHTILVIEDSDLMSEGASNALLKTLEEPDHSIILLITEMPEKIITTIRSRCQQIPFVSLDPETFHQVLDLKIKTKKKHPPELFNLAAGSPGILLYHFKQWHSLPKEIPQRFLNLKQSSIEILLLANDLYEVLNYSQQIWLLNWWQWQLWNKYFSVKQQTQLEVLRNQLISQVNSRLAWEVALLEIRSTLT